MKYGKRRPDNIAAAAVGAPGWVNADAHRCIAGPVTVVKVLKRRRPYPGINAKTINRIDDGRFYLLINAPLMSCDKLK